MEDTDRQTTQAPRKLSAERLRDTYSVAQVANGESRRNGRRIRSA